MVLISATLAFLISSGSFYLFSGYFPQMSGLEYADRVAKYFSAYLANTCLYVAIAAGVQMAVRTGMLPTPHGTGVGGAGPR
jgi:xanthine/uracil/vitamin C permease (AzgA family)